MHADWDGRDMLLDGLAKFAFRQTDFSGDLVTPLPPLVAPRNHLKIGLVLGGGAARGWSHIGVLRVLAREGIVPDVIAGCSIGAVVGGCYAAGKLDEIEAFALSLTKRRLMGLLDFHIRGSGLIAGERLRRLLEHDLADQRIETLPIRFGTVATELGSGHEIWLTRGPLIPALQASYALPGVFAPVRLGGRWLMDGALVNPVPVTVARAFGADLVICINLNGDIRIRGTVIQSHGADAADELVEAIAEEPRARGFFGSWREGARPAEKPPGAPGITGVMIDAFNITQDRISRSRLAGDPPDLVIAPKTSVIGLFEFHRAAESIELGRQAAERALPEIREILANGAGMPASHAVAI
jgi:NTE family protein